MRIMGRECALGTLLEKTRQAIDQLDAWRDGQAMFAQMAAARPELAKHFEAMPDGEPVTPAVREHMQRVFGGATVMKVKEIPTVVEGFVRHIDQRGTPPALRCALLGALALVAQPRDIVPDDAPGGYGYVDDAALLGAGAILVLQAARADATQIENAQKSVEFLSSLVPAASQLAMRTAVQGVALSFQTLSMLPAPVAELAAARLLDHPEGAAPQAPQPGWRSPFAAPGGHWNHGAWFEGNDVVIPGGPSLIGGQLFIPS